MYFYISSAKNKAITKKSKLLKTIRKCRYFSKHILKLITTVYMCLLPIF